MTAPDFDVLIDHDGFEFVQVLSHEPLDSLTASEPGLPCASLSLALLYRLEQPAWLDLDGIAYLLAQAFLDSREAGRAWAPTCAALRDTEHRQDTDGLLEADHEISAEADQLRAQLAELEVARTRIAELEGQLKRARSLSVDETAKVVQATINGISDYLTRNY